MLRGGQISAGQQSSSKGSARDLRFRCDSMCRPTRGPWWAAGGPMVRQNAPAVWSACASPPRAQRFTPRLNWTSACRRLRPPRHAAVLAALEPAPLLRGFSFKSSASLLQSVHCCPCRPELARADRSYTTTIASAATPVRGTQIRSGSRSMIANGACSPSIPASISGPQHPQLRLSACAAPTPT